MLIARTCFAPTELTIRGNGNGYKYSVPTGLKKIDVYAEKVVVIPSSLCFMRARDWSKKESRNAARECNLLEVLQPQKVVT